MRLILMYIIMYINTPREIERDILSHETQQTSVLLWQRLRVFRRVHLQKDIIIERFSGGPYPSRRVRCGNVYPSRPLN